MEPVISLNSSAIQCTSLSSNAPIWQDVLAQAIDVEGKADSCALLPMHFPHRGFVSQFTYPTRHTRGVGPLIDFSVVSRMLDAFVDVLL